MPLDGSEDLSCQALTELDRSDPGEDALVSNQHLLNGLAENRRLQILSGRFYFGKFGHGLLTSFLAKHSALRRAVYSEKQLSIYTSGPNLRAVAELWCWQQQKV